VSKEQDKRKGGVTDKGSGRFFQKCGMSFQKNSFSPIPGCARPARAEKLFIISHSNGKSYKLFHKRRIGIDIAIDNLL
jgi:hypothetical protein